MSDGLIWLIALWSILGFFYAVIRVFIYDESMHRELSDYKRTVRALEEQLAEETSGYE